MAMRLLPPSGEITVISTWHGIDVTATRLQLHRNHYTVVSSSSISQAVKLPIDPSSSDALDRANIRQVVGTRLHGSFIRSEERD